MRKLLLLLALCLAPPLHAADDYRDIKWEELVPRDWDPEDLKALDFGKLQDSDRAWHQASRVGFRSPRWALMVVVRDFAMRVGAVGTRK